jgi:hypothetical protein
MSNFEKFLIAAGVVFFVIAIIMFGILISML